jgi:hypothetical protein
MANPAAPLYLLLNTFEMKKSHQVQKQRTFYWEDKIQDLIEQKALEKFGRNKSAYIRYLVLKDNPEYLEAVRDSIDWCDRRWDVPCKPKAESGGRAKRRRPKLENWR